MQPSVFVILIVVTAAAVSAQQQQQRGRQSSDFQEVPAVASLATQGTETFYPCPGGFFLMQRMPGQPRGRANYWDGILSLQSWTYLRQVTLTLILDSVAKLEVDPNEAKLLTKSKGNYFQVQWIKTPPEINHIRFTVRSTPNTEFPNLHSLQLNVQELCESPTKWHPTSLSYGPELSAPLTPVVYPYESSANAQQPNAVSQQQPQHVYPQQNPNYQQYPAYNQPSTQPSVYPTQNAYTTQLTSTTRPTTARTTTDWSRTKQTLLTGRSTQATTASTSANKCGQRPIKHQSFVTHGHDAKHGDWPWHAAVYHKQGHGANTYKCGGTLVSNKAVLTAAHCLLDNGYVIISERVTVQLGKHKLNVFNPESREFEVYRIIIHPDFRRGELNDDLAMLILAQQVQFSLYIQPICLWRKDYSSLDYVIGKKGTVVGWGLTEFDSLSDTLKQGEMPVVNFATCLESNRDFFGAVLNDRTFCAGYRNGTSVCNGDSGGGLFFDDNAGTWFVRGLVSLSTVRDDRDVCNPQHYVVFTDVAKYYDWINKHL